MQNRCRRQRQSQQTAPAPAPIVPLQVEEPPVRRWPHPIRQEVPEPDLHYLCCTLSYQNQLLADIKSLMETLVQESGETSE